MILCYIFLFLVPFQEHPILGAQIFQIGSFPVTPIKALGIVLVLAAIVLPRPSDAAPRPSSGMLLLTALFALYPTAGTVLSSLPFPGYDLSALTSFVILMVATNTLVSTPKRMHNIIRAAVLAETFASTWLYKQYYIYHWPRPIGPSSDPNYEALSIVVALPLAIWLSQYEGTKFWRRVGLACAIILGFAVFVSQSRGGLLAMAVMALMVWLNSKHKFRFAAVLIVGAALVLTLAPGKMLSRLGEIQIDQFKAGTGPERSTLDRWELNRAGVHMMEAHPLFGVGLDQFTAQEIRYNPVLISIGGDGHPHIAHNTYLQIGAEGGVPTILLYLAILLATVFTCRSVEKHEGVPTDLVQLAHSVRVAMIGFMVAAFFLSAQLVKEPWVLIALAPPLYQIALNAVARKQKVATALAPQPLRPTQAVLTPRYRIG